jgi:hypothetical protein
LRAVRPGALQDAPYAFSSTCAGIAENPDTYWQEMAAQCAASPDACEIFLTRPLLSRPTP